MEFTLNHDLPHSNSLIPFLKYFSILLLYSDILFISLHEPRDNNLAQKTTKRQHAYLIEHMVESKVG